MSARGPRLAGFPRLSEDARANGASSLRYLLLAYVVMSLITFVCFGWDKRAARLGRWRVRESTLHGLELLGGFPGTLVGQRVFRHKTYKRSYRLVLWAIIALHAIAWFWWLWSRN